LLKPDGIKDKPTEGKWSDDDDENEDDRKGKLGVT
jgi:hypothetical protein